MFFPIMHKIVESKRNGRIKKINLFFLENIIIQLSITTIVVSDRKCCCQSMYEVLVDGLIHSIILLGISIVLMYILPRAPGQQKTRK